MIAGDASVLFESCDVLMDPPLLSPVSVAVTNPLMEPVAGVIVNEPKPVGLVVTVLLKTKRLA